MALDCIGRRFLDVMGKIYDLVNRGIRLRSLADNEAWAKRLDADPESTEWMTTYADRSSALLLRAVGEPGNCATYPGLAGLARARADGKWLGRPIVWARNR